LSRFNAGWDLNVRTIEYLAMSRDGFRGVFSQGQANFDSSVGDPIANTSLCLIFNDTSRRDAIYRVK
jgi:hypothetical protein